MASRQSKKRSSDPPPRSAPASTKRSRRSPTTSDSSESELSELEEESMTLPNADADADDNDDDDDEEDEADDEEDPSSEESPEEREDSYVYEDSDSAPTPAAVARRKPTRKSGLSKVSNAPVEDSITVRGGAGAKKGQQQQRGKQQQQGKHGDATAGSIKLTLKLGRDSSSDEEEEEDDVDVDAEGEDDDEVDAEGEDDDEDAEGEDEEDDGLNDEDAEGETDDEEMADSDEDAEGTPEFGSRAGTPDMSRLTKRQKSKLGDVYSADLLELPAGIERPSAAKATPLTADEQALKRAEMARRRKNLTDQRLEEEKMDTINKLLKKQTPKMRKSQQGRQTGDATPNEAGGPDGLVEAPPPPKMVRWVSNKDGIRMGVPESWLAGPVGRVFMPQGGGGGALVQEVGEGVVPMEIEA